MLTGHTADGRKIYSTGSNTSPEEVFLQQQGTVAANYAKQFLSQWNQKAAETKGIFNTAMASIQDLQPYIDKVSAYGNDINELIASAQSDLGAYRAKYTPLETEAIETSMMALGAQRGMMGQLQELSKADYQGVSGRAKADVSLEMDRARRAEGRNLQSFGLDPTSGRYRGSMRSSQINESLNKVLAANFARLAEKNRVAGVVQGGLQVVDPSKMGGDISKQISSGGIDYSRLIGGLAETGAGIQKTAVEAKTAGIRAGTDLASSYSRSLMEPNIEGFGAMLGTGMATDPLQLRNVGNVTGISP